MNTVALLRAYVLSKNLQKYLKSKKTIVLTYKTEPVGSKLTKVQTNVYKT